MVETEQEFKEVAQKGLGDVLDLSVKTGQGDGFR